MTVKTYAILPLLILCLFFSGCGTIREVPVRIVTKEVVRDTTIYRTDTITVEVPKEVIKEVLPEIDTSTLETSLALSTAFLDTTARVIHHELRNKTQPIQKEVEIPVKTITKTEYKEVEVPVKIPEPFIPKWCWFLVIFNIAYFGVKLGKLLTIIK